MTTVGVLNLESLRTSSRTVAGHADLYRKKETLGNDGGKLSEVRKDEEVTDGESTTKTKQINSVRPGIVANIVVCTTSMRLEIKYLRQAHIYVGHSNDLAR
ncbi:unnamed protein product [Pylaiella littoralis]